MPTIKNYFNGKVNLDDAVKRAKAKKCECTFAFGIGKTGSLLVLDYRNEYDPQKFCKELKLTEYKSKYIVGMALVEGKKIKMKSEAKYSKNSVKPKDVKDYLKENKLSVTIAEINGKGSEEDEQDGEKKK